MAKRKGEAAFVTPKDVEGLLALLGGVFRPGEDDLRAGALLLLLCYMEEGDEGARRAARAAAERALVPCTDAFNAASESLRESALVAARWGK